MNRFIVDGFNLLYRSHYALRKLSTTNNMASGSVYGFFNTLKSLKKRFSNCTFYVVWDSKILNKKAIFPDYKANRIPCYVNIPVDDIKEALGGLNITQVECPCEEADDVIASVVFQPNNGIDYIYSSDKDLLQLVKDGKVVVISPKAGKIQEKSYDEEKVRKKWGVDPVYLACLFALMGDSSDNIPGTSLPSKVLAFLCSKYRNLEDIYLNLGNENLTDFQKRTLMKNREQVFLNYSIILLKTDLKCIFNKGISDSNKLKKVFDKYEIRSFNPEEFTEIFDLNTSFLYRINSMCVETNRV